MKLTIINEKLYLDKLVAELDLNNEAIGFSVRKNDVMDVKIILNFFKEYDLEEIKTFGNINKSFKDFWLLFFTNLSFDPHGWSYT